jgi:hypothetical protein
MLSGGMNFKWGNKIKRFDRQYSQAQTWLDNEVIKDTTPYVPMNMGTLAKSAITGTKIGSGEIKWDTPYAKRLYYGTGFNFSPAQHPKGQAQWFEASKAVNQTKWLNGVRKIAGGGNK